MRVKSKAAGIHSSCLFNRLAGYSCVRVKNVRVANLRVKRAADVDRWLGALPRCCSPNNDRSRQITPDHVRSRTLGDALEALFDLAQVRQGQLQVDDVDVIKGVDLEVVGV